MTHAFTPATERALEAAQRFGPVLGLPQVLLGLLEESESFAATLLAEQQIDRATVLARFPDLEESTADLPRRAGQAPLLEMAVAAVAGQCADIPLPYELATEHLLLGVLLVGGEETEWLAAAGLDAAAVERRIRARFPRSAAHNTGESDEPLPNVDGDEPARLAESAPPRPAAGGTHPTALGHLPTAAWRALDASANRAREGLRVVEDFVRFGLDDPNLTGAIKNLRHELAAVLAELPPAQLFAARDTLGDVGTQISTPNELARADIASLVAANFRRASEALRSLEEFSKLVAPELAGRFEQLRYRGYTLERAVAVERASCETLAAAQLYVLLDGGATTAACEQLGRSLVAAGVDLLQLRAKQLDDRELLARAAALRRATAGTPTRLIINDRPDLAALVGADGVHLGQEDLSVRDARAIVGPASLIGVSTHSLAQARQAVLDGANYLGVGPTFPSATKSFASFTGLELLRSVAAEIRLPAFAIGGISLENLSAVQQAGFRRVAVSAAIVGAPAPAAAAAEFLRQLRRGGGGDRPVR